MRYFFLYLLPAIVALPSQQARSHSSNTSIDPALFSSLEEAARIVDIAYCVGTTGISPPFKCLSRCDEFPTFELIQEWNTGPLLSDSCGYIAVDQDPANNRIVLAFRGTYSIANTIADLSTLPQRYVPYLPDNGTTLHPFGDLPLSQRCDNCSVHAGFLTSWQNTRAVIFPVLETVTSAYPRHKVHVVGHSLGGAVGLLAALDLQARGWDPFVTTFGEPRVGNNAFVDYVDSHFQGGRYHRVTHADDPVPLLPPSRLGYKSHAHEVFIRKPALPPTIDDVRTCHGDEDENCIAAGDGSRLWQLFFAHRDYFWRLGLCIKGGDPWGWKGTYDKSVDEL